MLEDECIDYASSCPEHEVCGLIINDDRLIKCRNVHPNPTSHFRIDDEDWLTAETAGEITAVFHSHPGSVLVLSGADRQMQVATALPWWLASGGMLRRYRPVPHLLGRRFEHSTMDCYTLFRDAYHLCGIDLPDFERSNGWWMRGENLYLKNLAANGFHSVTRNDIQAGDVVIRRPYPEADPCHSMIYLGDGMVLHHDCAGRLSRREPYRQAYIKQTHSIWRHKQCSSLNLLGISADISAKSY